MKVLLITVIFNFETGSELETRMDFANIEDMSYRALETFENVDAAVTMLAMDVPEGQEMLDGTVIAYGART